MSYGQHQWAAGSIGFNCSSSSFWNLLELISPFLRPSPIKFYVDLKSLKGAFDIFFSEEILRRAFLRLDNWIPSTYQTQTLSALLSKSFLPHQKKTDNLVKVARDFDAIDLRRQFIWRSHKERRQQCKKMLTQLHCLIISSIFKRHNWFWKIIKLAKKPCCLELDAKGCHDKSCIWNTAMEYAHGGIYKKIMDTKQLHRFWEFLSGMWRNNRCKVKSKDLRIPCKFANLQ